ncbi:unnamed protein product [Chilo suppressalis]|uniref:PPIase cyclophilin-type domain-containing protein n=1 Tax=Chilo suppressalis TaxID=168631 RepID=A0ABN8BB64_CHISP|nr:unnamed protein product [Chilo suppressalis]
MTLVGAILEKVKSNTSVNKKYYSPPPENVENIEVPLKKSHKKKICHSNRVRAKVDTSPLPLDTTRWYRHLTEFRSSVLRINNENMELLRAIKEAHFKSGKVDCRWEAYPERTLNHYNNRVHFYQRMNKANEDMHRRIMKSGPKVVTTADHRRDWAKNRRKIIEGAQAKFVLFPPVPQACLEDEAFAAPPGFKRPRVYITLRIRGWAVMGVLTAELFTDVCPNTCRLFVELMDGDGSGFGYVGTCFFRKVPGLYWSGGDVSHNNGFGCYAQCGRTVPIGAENFHFSHSMPGLLSMCVTKDNEMCGIFNITFKPLPQFDLHNVVFGRIVRPCRTYESISQLGSALSTWPVVEVSATRRQLENGWVCGAPNTRVLDIRRLHRKRHEQ